MRTQEHPQSGRIPQLQASHIDHQLADAVVERVTQSLAHFGNAGGIDPAIDPQALTRLLVLNSRWPSVGAA